MNRITLEQLRTFLHVLRLGGVRRAAEALHLTQPAVTARLRNLENAVGFDLFDRTGGGLRPTRRGERLRDYAERFEHLTGMMGRDVIAPEAVEGRLHIGVSETIAQSWLPDLIYRLHGRYPNLEIEFNVDISINLRTALLNRGLDLVVLLGPVSEFSVKNVALPGFDLAWYAAAAAPRRADPHDHLKRPVLTYARQTRPYREIKEMLLERVGPDVALFPSTSLSACFRLVEADLGVAALPRALGAEHVARGTIREFDPGWVPQPLRFTASYLAEPRNPLIETAAQLAREVAIRHRDGTTDQIREA
ncbi:MAG: LysR family transcriptional regulator [Rhodobacteraceae bacterium]|nr:LysR family transcriptional regulator [Paracoccaceae bacterium]